MRLYIPIGIVLLPTGKGNIVPSGIENEIAKPIGADISIKPVTWPPIGSDDAKTEGTDVGKFNPDTTIMSSISEPVTIHTGIEDLVSLWDKFDESKIPTLDQCLIGDNDEEFEEPEIKEFDFDKDSIKDMICLEEPPQKVIDISAMDSSDSIVGDELDKESFFYFRILTIHDRNVWYIQLK